MTGDQDFDRLLERCLEILRTKSSDYAEESDRLAEIRQTARDMGISMRQVLGVYLNKHLRSVRKWVRGETLLGEPIEEKLVDVIVYCLLIGKLSHEEKVELVTYMQAEETVLQMPETLWRSRGCEHLDPNSDPPVLAVSIAGCARCTSGHPPTDRKTCRFHPSGCPDMRPLPDLGQEEDDDGHDEEE